MVMVMVVYRFITTMLSLLAPSLFTPTRGSVWFLLGIIAAVLRGKQHAMRPSVEAVQKILLLMLLDISMIDQIRNIWV
jgi:hypothetical protein